MNVMKIKCIYCGIDMSMEIKQDPTPLCVMCDEYWKTQHEYSDELSDKWWDFVHEYPELHVQFFKDKEDAIKDPITWSDIIRDMHNLGREEF